MLVQETIQPLLRYFSTGVTQDTNTPVVSIANAQAVRIVAHTGAVAGSATLRVFVNNVNDITGAVQIPSKAVPLASTSSYEIFVSGDEAYAAIARAAFLYVQIDVVENSSPSVPIAIEVSAFPGRSVPTSLPANWTRVL
jgi:hypothetical protein